MIHVGGGVHLSAYSSWLVECSSLGAYLAAVMHQLAAGNSMVRIVVATLC